MKGSGEFSVILKFNFEFDEIDSRDEGNKTGIGYLTQGQVWINLTLMLFQKVDFNHGCAGTWMSVGHIKFPLCLTFKLYC